MLKSHQKSVVATTPPDLSHGQPKFREKPFNDAIFDKGYDIYLEKALRCPCRITANKGALSNCFNCGGTGWVFINKKQTKAVIQSMNRQESNGKKWTEQDRGTSSVTLRSVDNIAFMDRLTLFHLKANYSEILKLKQVSNGAYTCRTVYQVLDLDQIMLFKGSEDPLYRLNTNQYTITDHGIRVTMDLSALEEPTLTVRYSHNPQFHIIDITRENFLQKGGELNCDPNDPGYLKDTLLPQHAVARRAHYILDAPDLLGESLFNNSSPSV